MHNALNVGDLRIRVTEDCLNGRRTAFDDPYKPGRNALVGISQVIEAQSPLDVVILLLGTNDFQSMHPHSAWHSAAGLASVINAVRTAPTEPGMPVPPILLTAPPQLDDPRGPIGPKFAGGDVASRGLSDAIRQVSEDTGCAFFDANSVTTSSTVDGVHLDADQHEILGRVLTPVVADLL
ncbi:SGNH/GDSL hydrolase family protein [Frigoribacterium sp. CG_9.8]|uniref:SGNH/GDSL hydrolase family protein n=1 Tax=Frigoribacterium sp. CG_9.8 TaxID=2787733 RepID=UPI0018C93663|nr:SGNH/GDSL hydrolase family protein [Frigoribacterium sp. CG_9.8]MBG6107024.1 lysophospholipase L1-like esterase [Frigoribacterium sp. CG_9.8]